MTTPRRDATPDNPLGGDTPLSAFLRHHPELDSKKFGYDCEDLDDLYTKIYYWHRYRCAELMLLEFKQHGMNVTKPQRDTFGVINQALQKAFSLPDFKVKRLYVDRPGKYTYFGYWLVQFENTSPLDGRIRINWKLVTLDEFMRFVKFDRQFFEERLHYSPGTICEQDMPAVVQKPKRRVSQRNQPKVATLFSTLYQPNLEGF